MSDNILDALNPSQRVAVEYCGGPQLVIAGAGSGKTRVLTYKVAYLLNNGVKPWHILALTFTNKAADEMKQRINAIVGGNQARDIYMGTFHSIFSRFLRREAEKIGYTSSFTIYDDSDSKSLVRALVKEFGLNDKVYKPSTVASRISMAKNHLILPGDYASNNQLLVRDMETHMPEMSKIYAEYCERCRRANSMDFDDLLVNTYRLLNNNEEAREKYATNFEYILVDEYQDTNAVQQKIVELLASVNHMVCAVGDDAQSIYAFRGANIDNMLAFETAFSGSRLFKLEQNYRSTRRIVEAANSLIRNNRRQIPKNVVSMGGEGDKLKVKQAYSDREEAAIVCRDIRQMMQSDGYQYSDFAILYRTNAQSRTFEDEMRKNGMPYKIFGGLSFYQRKEIKDIIAYFRVVANPDDEEALKRIINYPKRSIGNTTIEKVRDISNRNMVSLWAVIENPVRYGLSISKSTMTKLLDFKHMIEDFRERLNVDDALELGNHIIIRSGLRADLYSDSEPESVARQENLEEFMNAMQDFVITRREEAQGTAYLTDFLQEVSLLTDLESDEDDDTAKVKLMTVHSAKGLEFPNVFVVGMEENIFPSQMARDSQREIEEERRLLYVAITRAEKHCCLTCARNRYRFGKMEIDTPSRFLKELDASLLEVSGIGENQVTKNEKYGNAYGNMQYGNSRFQNSRPVASQFMADPKLREVKHVDDTYHFKKGDYKTVLGMGNRVPVAKAQTSSADSGDVALAEGQRVEHQRFGKGIVLSTEGTGENMKATVKFDNVGTKQLLMKFARLTLI